MKLGKRDKANIAIDKLASLSLLHVCGIPFMVMKYFYYDSTYIETELSILTINKELLADIIVEITEHL